MLKITVFSISLLPLAYVIYLIITDQLGVNPVETITAETGEWALRFLWLTLALRPLQKLLKKAWPAKLRRMLGLYSYFYLSTHLLTFFWLEHFWFFDDILADIFEHPYVLIGMSGFLLMTPLALTSNRFSIKKLGPSWKKLHRLVYIIALLSIVHYVWLVKADLLEPTIYLLLLICLFLWRLVTDLLSKKGKKITN